MHAHDPGGTQFLEVYDAIGSALFGQQDGTVQLAYLTACLAYAIGRCEYNGERLGTPTGVRFPHLPDYF